MTENVEQTSGTADSMAQHYLPEIEEYLTPKFKNLTMKFILPQILTGLLEIFSQGFSLETEMRHFGTEMVKCAVPFYTLGDIVGSLLPNAWSFVASSELETLLLEENHERRTLALASEFTVLPCFAILMSIIFGSLGNLLASLFYIPDQFRISFTINLILQPLVGFMGQTHYIRYLAEQRMIILLAGQVFTCLLSLSLEQFCYSMYLSSHPNNGNLISVITWFCVNLLFVTLNIGLAFGFTAYGFVVRNVNRLTIANLKQKPWEEIKIVLSQLFHSIPKFVIDATLPLSIAMSSLYINRSFSDDDLEFYSIADLFVFYFYMSAVKVCPLSFGRMLYIIESLARQKYCFKLANSLLVRLLCICVFLSGILLLIIYFGRSYFVHFLFPTTLDERLHLYVAEEQGKHAFTILTAGIINLLDAIPQAVTSYLFAENEVMLIFAIALAKLCISIILMQQIGQRIGDKANYTYVLIFGEGTSIALSILMLLLIVVEYLVIYRKKDESAIFTDRGSARQE